MDPVIYQTYLREREIACRHLDRLLDQFCRDFDMDPMVVWRRPRQAELDFTAYRRQWMLGIAPPLLGDRTFKVATP